MYEVYTGHYPPLLKINVALSYQVAKHPLYRLVNLYLGAKSCQRLGMRPQHLFCLPILVMGRESHSTVEAMVANNLPVSCLSFERLSILVPHFFTIP